MTIPRIASYPMPTVTAFPTNRVNWQVQPERAVLLIHDMQRYFLNFFDTQQPPIPDLLHNIAALRQACQTQGIPVLYTAQPAEQSEAERGLLSDFWGPGLGAYPSQAAIAASLAPDERDHVLVKWRYSAFQRTDLQSRLQREGRDQLILCGVYAHIGCLLTACEAFMSDIQTFFVGDAVADFSLEYHHIAMNYVAQRCGMALSSQTMLAMLSQVPDAGYRSQELSPVAVTQTLQQQLGELLQQPPQQVGVEENLLDWGLDSIRLMSLVETWRHKGAEVSFADLAEQPTIAAWTRLLAHTPDDRVQQGGQHTYG